MIFETVYYTADRWTHESKFESRGPMLFPKRQHGGAGPGIGGRAGVGAGKGENRKKVPELLDFVNKRDWSGAVGLLKFQLNLEEVMKDSSTVTGTNFQKYSLQ